MRKIVDGAVALRFLTAFSLMAFNYSARAQELFNNKEVEIRRDGNSYKTVRVSNEGFRNFRRIYEIEYGPDHEPWKRENWYICGKGKIIEGYLPKPLGDDVKLLKGSFKKNESELVTSLIWSENEKFGFKNSDGQELRHKAEVLEMIARSCSMEPIEPNADEIFFFGIGPWGVSSFLNRRLIVDDDIITVWINYYNAREVEWSGYMRYAQDTYLINHEVAREVQELQFDCKNNKMRFIVEISYNENGSPSGQKSGGNWSEIIPNTHGDEMRELICIIE